MAVRLFAEALSQGRSPVIYGNGKQTRDFTYVSDAVDGTILATEFEKSAGEIFNLGSGNRVTVERVVEIMKKAMDKVEVEPIYEMSRLGDVPDTYASIQKAKSMLGYEPKTSIGDGLKSFVAWFKQNRKQKEATN